MAESGAACTPRLPVFAQAGRRAIDIAEENLDLCYIAVQPYPKATLLAITFLREHSRTWKELTGEPSEAEFPRQGVYQTSRVLVDTIEFHYSTDISDLEQQYVASLARWTALRVGIVRCRTVGKVSETASTQGERIRNKNKYRVPCVFYNGHEKCLVIREEVWKQELSPDGMGVGVLCDEHGFQTHTEARECQMGQQVQALNGLVLPHVRKARELDRSRETLIHDELQRLSKLWPT